MLQLEISSPNWVVFASLCSLENTVMCIKLSLTPFPLFHTLWKIKEEDQWTKTTKSLQTGKMTFVTRNELNIYSWLKDYHKIIKNGSIKF